MLPPWSSLPPTSLGNALCTAPCSTRSFSWPSTRSRCSAMGWPSMRWRSGFAARSRAATRMSAHVPSSWRPSCSTSMRGDAGWASARGAGIGAATSSRAGFGGTVAGRRPEVFGVLRDAVSTIVGSRPSCARSGSFHGRPGPRRRGNEASAAYKRLARRLAEDCRDPTNARWLHVAVSTSGCRGIRSSDGRSVAEERARATRPEQEEHDRRERDAEVLADGPGRIRDGEEHRADDRQYLEDRDDDA